MKDEKLDSVIEEAERFLKKAKDLRQARVDDEKRVKAAKEKAAKESSFVYCGYLSFPKEHGAVRRASMDLTRALAEYRRY